MQNHCIKNDGKGKHLSGVLVNAVNIEFTRLFGFIYFHDRRKKWSGRQKSIHSPDINTPNTIFTSL